MLNDLTQGKPLKVIWRFSLPLLLSMAFQQMYNVADSMIVGWLVGSNALAAIGAAYPITLIFIAIATGLSMGASVVIGHLYGAKRMTMVKSAVNTVTLALCVFGIFISAVGVALSGPLMRVLGAPATIYNDARNYLIIYSVGILPMFIYNTTSAVFTGLGDSKRPLYFLILSSLLNILLDIIAVGPLKMGVAGAAWATVLAQLIAAALSGTVLFKRVGAIETEEKPKLFEKRVLTEMLRQSLPAVFQQSCIAIGHTFIQSLVNSYSESFIAGYEIASKIHNFAYMCFNTIGTALSSFVAQNFGAGKMKRIQKGYQISSAMCFGIAAFVVIIMQAFAPQLIGLFVDASKNPEVILAGSRYLRTISPAYLVICFIITTGGLLRGVGRVQVFLIITILDLGIRVSMSFVLTNLLGNYTGIFWAWYFGSIPDFAICLWLYRRMCRKGGLLAGES
ncbi:MAG: MATE family efflux transporter [Clostridiales bacterium]|jgi:putative MATE family efflux protein|nr:MATE family efflux transporter [Clostridiales bacterium]